MTDRNRIKNGVRKADTDNIFPNTHKVTADIQYGKHLQFSQTNKSSKVRIFHGIYASTTRDN